MSTGTFTLAADEPVLPAMARGDGAALRRCIDRYGALVWSIARRLSPNRDDAEDAVQEILFDLWRSAERFDPRAGEERVFIATVARRRLIDRLRRLRARRDVETLTDELLASLAAPETPDRFAEVGIARAALSALPSEQQRVIDLSLVSGLSHSEISRQTGLPLGTVKTMVRRGIGKVRTALRTDVRGARASSTVRRRRVSRAESDQLRVAN